MRQSKVNGMDIAVGAPLMSSDADIDAVIDIVAAEYQPDRPILSVMAMPNTRL